MTDTPPAAGGVMPNLSLLGALGDQFTARTRKWMTAYLAGMSIVSVSKRWYAVAARHLSFTITVDNTDDVYPDLHSWVLEQLPPKRQRSLLARSTRVGRGEGLVAGGADAPTERAEVHLFYDGRRSQMVRLDGHRVRITIEQERAFIGREDRYGQLWSRDRILMTTLSLAGRDAVLALVGQLAEDRCQRHQVRFHVATTWGDWVRSRDMLPRPLESVVLRAGQKEDLVDDLRKFLGDEEHYGRLGLPWHRGYLFTGPPGTGKTSLARALAAELELDLYYVPLSSIPDDAKLAQAVASIPPRSVLLLEDIDIVHGARQRDDSGGMVSLSGLLNCLDGVLTPYGLVAMLTTNKPEVIDPALLRPGRVDYPELKLDYVDDEQLWRLVHYALGFERSLPPLGDRLMTPADVVNVLKPHLDDPQAALAHLVAAMGEPNAAPPAAAGFPSHVVGVSTGQAPRSRLEARR